MKNFAGKVAAITGAGSGIGRALAINLASRGAHLALSDVNNEGLAETAKLAANVGINITTSILDVADKDAVFAWADAAASEHGKVNLIFNNAGVAMSDTLEDGSIENIEWLMNINFWGVVYGTKAFLPHLRAAEDGHIINISSLFGIISVPSQGAYNASKFAVRGYNECLRQELELSGGNVSLSSIHPGGINTNIARNARYDKQFDTDSNRKYAQAMLSRTTPDQAAEVILKGVMKNKRRVLIGADARLLDLISRLMPSLYQRLTQKASERSWKTKKA